MSKYENLWKWIKENKFDNFCMSFDDVEKILGFPIDHSFLSFKNELLNYGFNVKKISLKEKIVSFEKIKNNL